MAEGDIIHVIHPTTYFFHNGRIVLERSNELEQRDIQIDSLVRKVINSGGKVIHHRDKHRDDALVHFGNIMFSSNPHLKILLEERITKIVTTHYGLPIPNDLPSDFKDRELFMRYYTSVDGFREAIGTPSRNIIIGGLLECCVRNFIGFMLFNYSDFPIYCVEDLCVSEDQVKRRAAIREFEKHGVEVISYEEVMRRL